MSVIQSKKLTIKQKLMNFKKKITVLSHDKYITTPEFNKLTAQKVCCKISTSNLNNKDRF